MKISLTVLLSLGVTLCCQAALLSPDGREYQAIELAPDAPASTQFAAHELSELVRRTTGTILQISTASSKKTPVIRLGQRSGLTVDTLPVDGFYVRTTEDALLIAGRDAEKPTFAYRNPWGMDEMLNDRLGFSILQEQGTRCGVLRFLERFCNVRFYMPGDLGTVAPLQGDIRLPELNWEKAPFIPYRYCWYANLSCGFDSAVWAARAGFGGKAPLVIMHSYSLMNKYQESHPEFFALVDGKRAFGTECVAAPPGHLCLHAPGLPEAIASEAEEYFKQYPEQDVYPLVPGDGLTRICECAECQKDLNSDNPENRKFSRHVWDFTNRVARELALHCPDKKIGMLAYESYRMPPEDFKVEPNIVIMFVYSRPFLVDQNKTRELHEQMEAWSRMSPCSFYFWVWYLTHWSPWNNFPIIYPAVIEQEIRFMAANAKHRGEFIESENFSVDDDMSRMMTPGMQHLNLYLTGKLYWEPEAKVEDILREYYRLFYGPAEQPMKKFWTRSAAIWQEKMSQGKDLSPDQVFSASILEELNDYLQSARQLSKDQGVYDERIKLIADEFKVAYDRGANPRLTNIPEAPLLPIKQNTELGSTAPLRLFSSTGALSGPNTYVYIAYDRLNLYLRFLCYEKDIPQFSKGQTGPDEPAILEEDHVEIVLVPNASKNVSSGYSLAISSNGALLDRKLCTNGISDVSWQSGAEVAVKVEENRWIVDVTVPLGKISISDPNFADIMKANFYRVSYGSGQTSTVMWSPMESCETWFPEKFGRLSWKKAER